MLHPKTLMLCAGRIFFDLLNEPDAFNFAWSVQRTNPESQTPASQTVPAWGQLFTNTAAVLIQQEPALLFFAEGTGQKNIQGTAFGMTHFTLCRSTQSYHEHVWCLHHRPQGCGVDVCQKMLPTASLTETNIQRSAQKTTKQAMINAGMGFGINPLIYDNTEGKSNALVGLQYLAANAAVKAATIITPHIYGSGTTGECGVSLPSTCDP